MLKCGGALGCSVYGFNALKRALASPGRPRRLVSLGHPNPPHIPASIHTALVPRATQALVSPS